MSSKNIPPEKCVCGCNKFEKVNRYYDELGEVEFHLICSECKNTVGYWSYGEWY